MAYSYDPEEGGYDNPDDWWGGVGDVPDPNAAPPQEYPADPGGGWSEQLPAGHQQSGGEQQTMSGDNQNHTDESGQSSSSDYEQRMKDDLGDLYTPGAYEELKHHDFDQGWYDRIVKKENLRADNETGSTYHADGKGGYMDKKKPTGLNFSSLMGGGGGSGSGSGDGMDDMMGQLKKLFPDGMFNQDLVTRRVSNASDSLQRQQKSQLANNQAYLADRGLIGSGPEAGAYTNMSDRLNQNFNQSVNDIYADESGKADNRMMQALQMATGLSVSQAQMVIDRFRANTEHDLGFGNLDARNREADMNYGLGMFNANNNFTLGQGNLALGNVNSQNQNNQFYDALQHSIESGNTDQLIELIKIMMGGADTSAGGHY